MATVTPRAIIIAAPLIQVRPVVASVNDQLRTAGEEISLSELPPIMPDGTPRTQLIVRDHRTSSRPPGLSVSQELLRTIRDRAERQPDGTFTAA